MQIPWLRSGIDRNYLVELQELDDTNHWSENDDDERCIKLERQVKEFKVKMLGKDMKLCNYPVELCTGSKSDKLNEEGEKLVKGGPIVMCLILLCFVVFMMVLHLFLYHLI